MARAEPKPLSDRRSREVRLGVVMFGGISLAVYINGVARELFRASRGRGVYRLLKALTDSEVVVDVLSGASAGGINGILLSTALCNGTEFDHTGTLWRDHADIGPLLTPYGNEQIDNSVLSGRYHQHQMVTAFADLLKVGGPMTLGAEDPSPVDELDLFITGTDIDGSISYRLDAMKHRIQLEDHRVLFQLKHRNERKEPFVSPNTTALATLAHITSCFPGAFVPLTVQVPPVTAVDKSLVSWGALEALDENGRVVPRQVTLMDGGVLKNKPFTSTIQAIFSRLADTQVSRYMLYVDPDPQEAANACKEQAALAKGDQEPQDTERHLVPVAFAAASDLPRFESIDADLQSIDTHNAQVRRYEALVGAATRTVMADPTLPASSHTANRTFELARLAALAQFVENALPNDLLRTQEILPGAIFEALQGFGGVSAAFGSAWGVWFGFRRLIQLTYSADDSAHVGKPDEKGHRITFSVPARAAGQPVRACRVESELLTVLNRQIELYEIVSARVQEAIAALALTKPPVNPTSKDGWVEIEQAVLGVLARLPHPACFNPQFPLEPLKNCVTAAELLALRDRSASPAADSPPFLHAAELFEQRLLQHFSNTGPLLELYERFVHIDEVALPLALVSELKGRDQIHTVRVSPLDSKRAFAKRFETQGGPRPVNKLCGMQLFDFGAFFKPSWRSNDLMWGRIDGLSQLLDILLDAKRLEQLEQALLQKNLDAALGGQWDLSVVLPHSSRAQLAVLHAWLEQLVKGDKAKALADLTKDDTLREAWAYAAQLEVLAEELPQVLGYCENECKADPNALGAVQRQQRQVTSGSQQQIGAAIDAYFWPNQYKVGAENLLLDLPVSTLKKYADRAGKHLREALEKSLPTDHLVERLFKDSADVGLRFVQKSLPLYLQWRASKARKEAEKE